jgi:hypothetical protein
VRKAGRPPVGDPGLTDRDVGLRLRQCDAEVAVVNARQSWAGFDRLIGGDGRVVRLCAEVEMARTMDAVP